MTTPGNINAPNTLPNAANTQQSRQDQLNSAAREFAKTRYEKQGVEFYNKIKDARNYRAAILGDFAGFSQFGGNVVSILAGGNQGGLQLSRQEEDDVLKIIQEETFKLGLTLQSKRDNFIHILDTQYSVGKTDREKIITEIDKYPEEKMDELVKQVLANGGEMMNFFEQNGKKLKLKKIPVHRDFGDFIQQLHLDYNRLSLKQRETLKSLFDYYDRFHQFGDDEIEALFTGENAIFQTVQQKKQFLRMFFPVVSLQQLQQIGGISERGVHEAVRKFLEKSANDFDVRNPQIIDTLTKDQNLLKQIKIPTLHLQLDSSDIDRIISGPASEQFLSYLNQAKDETLKKEISQSRDSLIAFKEKLFQAEKSEKTLIEGSDKIKKGSIFQMVFESGGNQTVEYYEITEVDIETTNGKRGLSFSLIAEDGLYYTDNKKKKFKKSYDAFEEFVKKGTGQSQQQDGELQTVRVKVLDSVEFSKNIKPNLRKIERTPRVTTEYDINSELSIKRATVGSFEEQIEDKKKLKIDIENQIEEINGKLAHSGNLDPTEIDHLKEKKVQLQGWIKTIEQDIIALKTLHKDALEDLEDEEGKVGNHDLITRNNLEQNLDKIDPSGKGIKLEEGTYLLPANGKGLGWKITYMGTSGVQIQSADGKVESLDFESFLRGCEKNSIRRYDIKNFTELKSQVAKYNGKFDKLINEFSGIIEHNGKLHLDQGGKPSKNPLNYFMIQDGEHKGKMLKVESISGNKVIIRTGKIKESFGKSERAGRFAKDKKTTYELNSSTDEFSLSEFYGIISTFGYIPETKDVIPPKEEPYKDSPLKTNLWWRYTQFYSFSTMIHGVKMITDSIHHSFEHGDEVLSAHFALGLSKFLPSKEWRRDLKEKVESHEREETDKYIKKLGSVDSSVASKRIYDWITNRDTPTYQLEAAVMYMYQKYGSLYVKQRLENERGNWLWYKAFGGKPGDAFFEEKKKECHDKDIPFTEEKLVYWWIQRICKTQEEGKHIHGTRHLRSRLHKELKGMWPEGIKKEAGDGAKDAGDIRTTEAQLEFMFSEFSGGSYGNVFGDGQQGMGAYTRLISRGGPAWHYEMMPFIAFFSGEIYDMDEKVIRHIKNLSRDGQVNVGPLFMSKFHMMNQYNNVILDLCKDIQDAYPGDFGNIFNEAVQMYTTVFNYTGDPRAYGTDRGSSGASYKVSRPQRLKAAWDFFNKYGEVITNCLYTANGTGKFHKVKKVMEVKRNENANYRIFQNELKQGILADTNYKADNQPITDSYNGSGYTGIDFRLAAGAVLGINTRSLGWKEESKVTDLIWGEMERDINALRDEPQGVYGNTQEEDRNMRIKTLKIHLADIFNHLYSELGGNTQLIQRMIEEAQTNPGVDLRKWGVTYNDVAQFNGNDFTRPPSEDVDKKLEKVAMRVLTHKSIPEKRGDNVVQSQPKGKFEGYGDEIPKRVNQTIEHDFRQSPQQKHHVDVPELDDPLDMGD